MIESMRVERFKSFRDATLKLGPLTVIVGTNASRKSNLRDAFRFVHGVSCGYTLAEIIGEKYVEGGVLQWKGIRGGMREVAFSGMSDFRLVITLSPPTNEGFRLPCKLVHEIHVGVGDARSGPRVPRESLYKDDSIVFDSHPDDDPPEQEGPPYLFVRLPRDSRNRKHGKRLRFLDNQPVLSQFPEHGEAAKAYREAAKAYREAALSYAALESMRFLDLSPEAMKIPSFPGQVVLGDRGENLSSVLQAICQDENMRRAVAEWVRELTPLDVVDFEFVPDQTGRVLVSLVESNGQHTSAYSASASTLRWPIGWKASRKDIFGACWMFPKRGACSRDRTWPGSTSRAGWRMPWLSRNRRRRRRTRPDHPRGFSQGPVCRRADRSPDARRSRQAERERPRLPRPLDGLAPAPARRD